MSQIEELLLEAERCALIRVVRGHPRWTLEELFRHLDGKRGEGLGKIKISELGDASLGAIFIPGDGGPPVDPAEVERISRLEGHAFLECMRQVLQEAEFPVGASYLRARLGGPRWKLQGAIAKLEARGELVRSGKTSGTRYSPKA